MKEKINIAELLKDCPGGMELDCAICENVYFDKVDSDLIKCFIKNDVYENIYFYRDGTHISAQNAKCVIFPKGKTTWEGFQRPFKDGDIITCTNAICSFTAIFKEMVSEYKFDRYAVLTLDENSRFRTNSGTSAFENPRFATEEEKQRFFQAIKDNGYKWNSEYKTLEELSPNFRECSDNEPLDIPTMTTEFVKEHGLPCPNGYIFKDDNGNEILTNKIILEKKKKEYPKTYKECFNVCFGNKHHIIQVVGLDGLGDNKELFESFIKLKICRDAYWKIYGEEMGLGKPWEPNWTTFEGMPAIFRFRYNIVCDFVCDSIKSQHCLLVFPTVEMRNSFYENYMDLIEQCKELL